jgi:hypothetical protein
LLFIVAYSSIDLYIRVISFLLKVELVQTQVSGGASESLRYSVSCISIIHMKKAVVTAHASPLAAELCLLLASNGYTICGYDRSVNPLHDLYEDSVLEQVVADCSDAQLIVLNSRIRSIDYLDRVWALRRNQLCHIITISSATNYFLKFQDRDPSYHLYAAYKARLDQRVKDLLREFWLDSLKGPWITNIRPGYMDVAEHENKSHYKQEPRVVAQEIMHCIQRVSTEPRSLIAELTVF